MKQIGRGEIRIFTYKEGLLSSVAHDLVLDLGAFDVKFNGGDILAAFDLSSIRVIGAIENGVLSENTLSASDRGKIEKTINSDVLQTRRFPKAELSGRIVDGSMEGTLTLKGQSQVIQGAVATMNGRANGWVEFRPSRWGIKPYTALFGALRLQDRVRIEYWMDLPL